MRDWQKFAGFLLLALVLLLSGEPTPGSRLRLVYGSVPKGLVLDGVARGLGKIETISYDPEHHRFVLNRQQYYNVPPAISREELADIFDGLGKNDRLGVTYTPGGKVMVYGSVDRGSPVLQDLAKADRLLVSMIFGWEKNLRDVELPGGWKPRPDDGASPPLICMTVFKDYAFTNTEGTFYRTNVGMSNLLIPMSDKTSGDGGYKEGTGAAEPRGAEKENLEYLKAHAAEFLRIPLLNKAASAGEVAAVARYLRDQGKLDLRKLADHVRKAR